MIAFQVGTRELSLIGGWLIFDMPSIARSAWVLQFTVAR
jgi:hypothetical protein